MRKHTPGPWHRNGHNLSEVIVVLDGPDKNGVEYQGGRHQVSVATCHGEDWDENSRLIAAAPDLLAVLESVKANWSYDHANGTNCRFCDQYDGHDPDCEIIRVRAALAKARG